MELSQHPFSQENISRELNDQSDAAWLRWCAEAERLLGHDLDGNDVDQTGDGYSLDEAYDVFRQGHSAHAYAAMVGSRDRYSPTAA